MKKSENILSDGMSQQNKNSVYTISFNIYGVLEWVIQYRNTRNEVELQVFEKLTTEPIKRERKYMNG